MLNIATVVGEAPIGLVTLSSAELTIQRFKAAVKAIWGVATKGLRKVDKGYVVPGLTINWALDVLKIKLDVVGKEALWSHPREKDSDWYFVTAPEGSGFNGELSFRAIGSAVLRNRVTGTSHPIKSDLEEQYSKVKLGLFRAESCFIVFRKIASLW